jgi:glyoxylase-like metal-dependent hydrolase (beta-lactamase superfamily II)
VADNVFVFMSELYAQVASTAILTSAGAVVVDAMPFPAEAREVIAFIEREAGQNGIRYLVLSHHHADHVYGAYLFDEAEVIAQRGCRRALENIGESSLMRAKRDTPALSEVELRLPDMAFDREMHLHLGDAHLRLFHTPGHTADGISAFYAEEKILIGGDAMMPVPHIVHGDAEQLKASLKAMRALRPSFLVQGHGDVLLRGEITESIDENIAYLNSIVERVRDVIKRGDAPSSLRAIDIESCGKSRIPLDGLVAKLHLDNLVTLYKQMAA